MKSFTLILVTVFILGITAGCTSDDHKSASESQRDLYTCPMHPSVISDRPGACPVCGMALVKKSAQRELSGEELDELQQVSFSPTQRVVANVAVTNVERHNITKEISAVGVIDYAEPMQAILAARFRGRIEKLHASFTGATVKKGDPLFDLYSPDLISTQRELVLALRALKSRSGEVGPVDFVSETQLLESSRSRLQTHFGMTTDQIAEIERTGVVHQSLTFYAPLSGTVIRKQVVEGQYVEEGTILYQLADLSKVWIYLDVYEQDLRHVKVGQYVRIQVDAYPNELFSGKVIFIDPVMNPDTRTIRVRTEFANPSGKLKPQMFVRANIQETVKQTLAVPSSALLSMGNRTVVWVEVDQNTFEPRNVVVGVRTPSLSQILSGLDGGERVVTTGGYLIDSESLLSLPAAPAARGDHLHADLPSRSASSPIPTAVGEINILVKGRYTPDVLRVKKGEPVKLHFYRDEKSLCTEEIVFEELGIREKLPAFKTTTITITPPKAGEIHFSCGMNMLHGRIIVMDE